MDDCRHCLAELQRITEHEVFDNQCLLSICYIYLQLHVNKFLPPPKITIKISASFLSPRMDVPAVVKTDNAIHAYRVAAPCSFYTIEHFYTFS